MARAGLRRGEVCGLRRSDVHLLVDSRRLGCEVARAHLHVVRREDNPNQAWAKSRRQRVVPLDFLVVQAFDVYEFERMRVAGAADSDFVFVNLFRGKLGAPMRPDAIGELMAAASRRAGLDVAVRPHQLRHAYGSNVVDAGAGYRCGRRSAWSRGGLLVAGLPASGHLPAAGRRGCGAQPSRAGRGDPVTAVGLADDVAVEQDCGRVPARVGRGRAGSARPRVWRRCSTADSWTRRGGIPDAGAVVAGGASVVGPDGVPGRGMPEQRSLRSRRCVTGASPA